MRYLYFIVIFFTVPVFSIYAYLDPGTGSMIVSAVIGALATVIYVFKGWFFKIARIFRNKKTDNGNSDSEDI